MDQGSHPPRLWRRRRPRRPARAAQPPPSRSGRPAVRAGSSRPLSPFESRVMPAARAARSSVTQSWPGAKAAWRWSSETQAWQAVCCKSGCKRAAARPARTRVDAGDAGDDGSPQHARAWHARGRRWRARRGRGGCGRQSACPRARGCGRRGRRGRAVAQRGMRTWAPWTRPACAGGEGRSQRAATTRRRGPSQHGAVGRGPAAGRAGQAVEGEGTPLRSPEVRRGVMAAAAAQARALAWPWRCL